jgi:hypothetical protein
MLFNISQKGAFFIDVIYLQKNWTYLLTELKQISTRDCHVERRVKKWTYSSEKELYMVIKSMMIIVCGTRSRVVRQIVMSVSEQPAASIFNVEDGGSNFPFKLW